MERTVVKLVFRISPSPEYASICQSCVYQCHPIMLTGYCLTDCVCDCCGRLADLAMVKVEHRA